VSVQSGACPIPRRQYGSQNLGDVTLSVSRVLAAVALVIGLAMTSWSGWSLVKSEAPGPQIRPDEERVWMCQPSLSELVGIKGIKVPFGTIGLIVVFGVGLAISARSAREFLPPSAPSFPDG
jgi:hypothetical protein